MSTNEMKTDNAESRLAETLFIVEATTNEQQILWSVWSEESDCTSQHRPTTKQVWRQRNGWLVTVGKLDGMPVSVSVTWNEIDSQLVMFFEAVSLVVDHRLIDNWLDEHFTGKWDNGTRMARTDACNFHQCVRAIEEANDLGH